jgi:DNA-binding transcriptional LysR family regulator
VSHWQSLSVFLAVAEEGSFSGAAKKLALTQPTVSFHIDNLEKKLGCPLVERTAKGAALTVYGQVLYENTGKADALLAAAESQLRAMVAGAAGRVTLGASTIPAEYVLPGLVAAFLRAHPGLDVVLRTGDSQSVLAAFAAGHFPIAVVGVHPGPDWLVQPLWADELVLAAHPALAATVGDAPSLADALALPLVSRPLSSGSMRAVLDALAAHGAGPADLRVVFQVGGNEALKAAIASQAGAGFIFRLAIRDELAAGRLAAITPPGLAIHRRFYAACRPPLVPTAVKTFWDYLVASGE